MESDGVFLAGQRQPKLAHLRIDQQVRLNGRHIDQQVRLNGRRVNRHAGGEPRQPAMWLRVQ
ncbi:hypothetical protein ACIBL6_20210 [Streptomyces sp. NPDC050400]|uniref:hypothetical protein n=1 Tax=Streptomyces sp. NPDC050400 TaxID=3365610 RepID=UPI00379BC71A